MYVEYSGAAIANEKWPLQVTGYYHNVRGQRLSSETKLLNFTAILKISFCHFTADFAFAAEFAASYFAAVDFAAAEEGILHKLLGFNWSNQLISSLSSFYEN